MTSSQLQLGVVGDPVTQSPSPEMFNPALHALGIQGEYKRYHVLEKDLGEFIQTVRTTPLQGLNVTIPHKQNIISFLDGVTPTAKNIGAVNTVYWENEKLMGHNTDGDGYFLSLQPHLQKPLNACDTTLAGAGGASRAIAYTLLKQGCQSLTLTNRSFDKAADLQKHLLQFFSEDRVHVLPWDDFLKNSHPSTSLFINTTSLGLKNQNPWPHFDFLKSFSSDVLISDIVANPIKTSLLKAAEEHNFKTLPGWEMLLYQGVLAFEKFTGEKPDVSLMRKALLEKLGCAFDSKLY